MKPSVQITGMEKIKLRLEEVAKAKRYEAHVLIEGKRNQDLAGIHANGAILRGAKSSLARFKSGKRKGELKRTTSGILPARRPFFIQSGMVERLIDEMRAGVRRISRGEPATTMKVTMDKVGGRAAQSVRGNIAPPGAMAGTGRGVHLPAPDVTGRGTKMAKLKPATIARKIRKYGQSRRPLIDTGELYRSIKSITVVRSA